MSLLMKRRCCCGETPWEPATDPCTSYCATATSPKYVTLTLVGWTPCPCIGAQGLYVGDINGTYTLTESVACAWQSDTLIVGTYRNYNIGSNCTGSFTTSNVRVRFTVRLRVDATVGGPALDVDGNGVSGAPPFHVGAMIPWTPGTTCHPASYTVNQYSDNPACVGSMAYSGGYFIVTF